MPSAANRASGCLILLACYHEKYGRLSSRPATNAVRLTGMYSSEALCLLHVSAFSIQHCSSGKREKKKRRETKRSNSMFKTLNSDFQRYEHTDLVEL